MNETKIIHVAWAVEFGGSAVRRLRLTRTDDGYRADRFAEVPLSSRWTSRPDIAAAAGLLPAEDVTEPLIACLGDDLVLYRTIRLPHADDATLEKMIHSQLETLLPAQMEKFVTAWKAQPDPADENLRHVLLCAVRRESLTSIAGVCTRWQKGGTDVTSSMPALAIAWSELSGSNEPVLLMDVAARSTTIAIVQDRRMWRCAVVDSGGDAWTEKIATSLNVSCEEAERKKLESAQQDDPSVHNVLEEAIFTWTNGVKEAYIDCLTGIPADARPARCVLFGRAGRLADVAPRISKTLGMAAAVAQTPETLRLEEGMAFDSVGPLVGAAIGIMQEPPSILRLVRGKEDQLLGSRPKRWHWAAAAGWLLASVMTLYALDLYQASHAETTVDAVYRETYHQDGLVRQQAVGDFLENGAPVPLDVLERITQAAPESIILSSCTYARNGQMTLQGTVANEKECQDFLQKLTELGEMELRRAWPDKNLFRFEINVTIGRSFGAASRSATQPASKPATQPVTAPASAPATVPTTAPAVAPANTAANAPASQPASQPTGGAK